MRVGEMKAYSQETKGPANSTADTGGAKKAEIMRENGDYRCRF